MKKLILYTMYLILCCCVKTIIQYIANDRNKYLKEILKNESKDFLQISTED